MREASKPGVFLTEPRSVHPAPECKGLSKGWCHLTSSWHRILGQLHNHRVASNNPLRHLVPVLASRKCHQSSFWWGRDATTDCCVWISVTVNSFRAWTSPGQSPAHTFPSTLGCSKSWILQPLHPYRAEGLASPLLWPVISLFMPAPVATSQGISVYKSSKDCNYLLPRKTGTAQEKLGSQGQRASRVTLDLFPGSS